ncbi:helix-turn-helix domain-containing protein [Pseudomonas sp. MYb185]|uniref:helix-turn-helix domain-containing protein n=1 Tax=Pseudomonas sp. MYb185 TaxID=1848729 RepID=UPI000CFD787A|nr:XRE family transcriptional regulator [Pseudomonas sp. MYb185]PRB82976.1 XRE family transcriptional regulator [Pseudomonas sp. MYb185]
MDKPSLDALGHHLQRLRQRCGLSLSQLAADAGIAKSNLSRLEQGNGNPTLDTIWRLAARLQVPFGDLIAPLNVAVEDGGVQVRLIDQGDGDPRVDAYWMSCAPNTLRKAEPHSAGTCESITVLSGQLEIGTHDGSRPLSAGQSHSFAADQPHQYRTGEAGATLLVVVIYAREGETA